MRKAFRVAAAAASVLIAGCTVAATSGMASAVNAPNVLPNYQTSALTYSGAVPTGIFAQKTQGVKAAADPSANELLDSDIELFAGTESGYSMAAQGRLQLHKTHGSTYAGSFFDDLSNKTYSASATKVSTTDETGIYTIDTANGKFVISETGSDSSASSKVPSKYGKDSEAGLGYDVHAYTVHTGYEFEVSQFSIGKYVPMSTGTLTFTTDASGFVVPRNKGRGIVGHYDYTEGTHKGTALISSWGEYYESDGDPVYALFSVKLNGHDIHFISDEYEDGETNSTTIEGTGVSGHSAQMTLLEFELTTPPAPTD